MLRNRPGKELHPVCRQDQHKNSDSHGHDVAVFRPHATQHLFGDPAHDHFPNQLDFVGHRRSNPVPHVEAEHQDSAAGDSVPQIVSRLKVRPPTVVVTWSPTGMGGTASKWALSICIPFAMAREGKAVARCPRSRDLNLALALPAAFGAAGFGAVRRGQTSQLKPLIAPEGAQRVRHQQHLECDEPGDHPKPHRAHEKKERKSDNGDGPEAPGDTTGVGPASIWPSSVL